MAVDWYSELVATTLEMPGVTEGIKFRYRGLQISGSDYKKIASSLRKGSDDGGLTVKRTTKNPDSRGWFEGKTKMIGINHTLENQHVQIPSKSPGERLKEYSTWVHEATHAIQYMNRWKITVGTAEIMAHLAQAMFLSRYGSNLLYNNRLSAAGVIAGKLSDGDPETSATKEDITALVDALKTVERYRKRWDKIFYIGQDLDAG